MTLKPQDLLVSLKILCLQDRSWTFPEMAAMLQISTGEAYNASKRSKQAGLVYGDGTLKVSPKRLLEFIVHGVPSVFFPERGGLAKGCPTSIFATPLKGKFTVSADEIPLVWESEDGTARGETVAPLYPSAVKAAALDGKLYLLLALVDVLRVGKTREKRAAADMLAKMILPEDSGKAEAT